MRVRERCPQLWYSEGWVWACILPRGHKTGHDFLEKIPRETKTRESKGKRE